MWYLAVMMLASATTGQETVCGPMPSSFIDPGNTHFIAAHKAYQVVQINAYMMPYHVFDVKGYVAGTIWHRSGSVELQTLHGRGQGLLVHVANSDWINMTSLTGEIYSKHTKNETDLEKIGSYICGDFNAQEALITTFDCLREGDEESFPKARYQIILAFGHDSSGQNKSFVVIVTEVLPGSAWDYLSSVKYRHYLYFDSEYYPIPITANNVMAIDVTSREGFTADVQPDVLIPPCTSAKLMCTITRAGVLTDFSGNVTTAPKMKVILVEWNPPLDKCKFKLITNFKAEGGYQWTCLAVGLRANVDKYFRYLDFDRTDGKISQRGFKCQTTCQSEPSTFPFVVEDVTTNTTYATIDEVQQNSKYTVRPTECTHDSRPNYKLTYDFSAPDAQPVATLEIDERFYAANKDQMSGLCVGEAP